MAPVRRTVPEVTSTGFRLGPARVLIADQHPIVRRGLAAVIAETSDLTICGEADDTASAEALIAELRPHLLLIELPLKDSHALPLIKRLASDSAVKMLVFSHCDERVFAERAVRAGAHGFLSKTAPVGEVIGAMRHVLSDRIYLSEQVTDRMLTRAVRGTFEDGSPIATLSNRELEVFELVGRGLPTRLIAQRLVLSPKTVETYRENIKLKLHLRNASELTRQAVQWVLERS